MGKKCLKCGYERQPSDMAPDYECPGCGAIYAKVEALKQEKESDHETSQKVPVDLKDKEIYPFSFPNWGRLMDWLSLSFLLPGSLKLEAAPVDLPPATLGQRIWATISTFFHMVFMVWLMRLAATIVGTLNLRLSGEYSTRNIYVEGAGYFNFADQTNNYIAACGGIGGLVGLILSLFLLPVLWRGHSFGQRAMGILVVPSSDEEIEDLSGLGLMIRKLTFRTRSACAQPMSKRPWNKALLPFAALFVLQIGLLAVFWPASKLLEATGFSGDNGSPTISTQELRKQKEEQQRQREAMMESMAINALKRRSESGDRYASEALQHMQEQRTRPNTAQMNNYRMWQNWAQMVRQRARNINDEFEHTITIQSWNGERVEIARDNVEEIIEQERPEGP